MSLAINKFWSNVQKQYQSALIIVKINLQIIWRLFKKKKTVVTCDVAKKKLFFFFELNSKIICTQITVSG